MTTNCLPDKFGATPLQRLQGNLAALSGIVNSSLSPEQIQDKDWQRAAHLVEAAQTCLEQHQAEEA